MPRIVRKNGSKAKKIYKPWNAAKALPLLLEDFGNRCAYSLVHKDTLAKRQLHVDHFDPKKKKRCTYDNLYPAHDVVNEAKLDSPVVSYANPKAHLLDPCKVDDYNHLIFENRATGELEPHPDSVSAAYHLEIMDLNNPYFLTKRLDRTTKKRILAASFPVITAEHQVLLKTIEAELPKLIPEIAEMPQHLKFKAGLKIVPVPPAAAPKKKT